jgi:hypothetical protein
MATQIQFRQGNAAAVPALNIGEPGWSVDTKTLNVGDGSGTPPQVMTSKSTGTFSYPNIVSAKFPRLISGPGTLAAVSYFFNDNDGTTGLYSPGTGQVSIAATGVDRLVANSTGLAITGDVTVQTGNRYDTVDVSALNPSNVVGLMVKTGDSTYAFRSLLPGAGMAAATDGNGNANAGGTIGNLTFGLANNPTIPGQGGVQLPAGTTGQQTQIAAANGVVRYNNTENYFEGYIDGEWRPFVDYVAGHVANVPSEFSDIQSAINYYASRSTGGTVTVKLAPGTYTVAASLSAASLTNSVIVQGAAPISIALDPNTPVVSVTGSAGAWLVTYKLSAAIPTGMTTDYSVVIDSLYGSGDCPVVGNFSVLADGVFVSQTSLSTVKTVSQNANLNLWYSVNDNIMLAATGQPPVIRKITAITNNNTMTLNAPMLAGTQTNYFHRRLVSLVGTLSATNSTTVNGTNTTFTTALNAGDLLILGTSNQVVEVESITNNTTLVVGQAVTCTNEAAYVISSCVTHLGCWQIQSLNTVNNYVTVLNTSQSQQPPINGITAGSIVFLPSAILFTSGVLAQIASGQSLGFQNVTARYTGANPTANNYFILGADCTASIQGIVGVNNASIYINSGSEIAANAGTLHISGIQATAFALGLIGNSSIQIGRLICSGNGGYGLSSGHSDFSCTGTSFFVGNGLNGVYTASVGKTNLGTMGSVSYNGNNGVFCRNGSNLEAVAFNFNSNGQSGLQVLDGSQVTLNYSTLILSNTNNGILATTGNVIKIDSSLIACHGVYGATVAGSTLELFGTYVVSNVANGVSLGSKASLALTGSAPAGSFAHVFDYNAATFNASLSSCISASDNSTVTGQQVSLNKRAASFDCYATNASLVSFYTAVGSGASNSVVSSPLVNTFGTTNYGSAVIVNNSIL